MSADRTLADRMRARMYGDARVEYSTSSVGEATYWLITDLRNELARCGATRSFHNWQWRHHPIFHTCAIRLQHLHSVVAVWSLRNKYMLDATMRGIRRDIQCDGRKS